jgi:hypothetical protein
MCPREIAEKVFLEILKGVEDNKTVRVLNTQKTFVVPLKGGFGLE